MTDSSHKFTFRATAARRMVKLVAMNYEIRKLTSLEAMLPSLGLVQELTPDVTAEEYQQMLGEMIPHNYRQVGAYDKGKLIAVSGYWIGTKIYCGKYLEIDNFVVSKEYRSKGVGQLLVGWMLAEARAQACRASLLDAYVENFKAHKFYHGQGFIARGFHYLKWL